jgi:TRAP transporter TAXI family solute receptor
MILSITMIAGCANTGSAQTAEPSVESPAKGGKTKQFLSIATAQLGGGTYNSGLAVATAANLGMDTYKVEALPTSGVIESARMLRDGEAEIATLGNDVVFELANAKGRFEGEGLDDVSVILPQFATYVNIVVPAKSDIKTIEDMKGKKIGVGNPGSAGYNLITHILRAHGLNEGDYEEIALSAAEQTASLKDGHQDVFGFYTTPNSPAIVELATTVDCRWIDINKEKWDAYAEANGLPFEVVVSPDEYKGMEGEVLMLSGTQWFVTKKSSDEEMVYEFTKAFLENFDAAVQMVASIADIKTLLPNNEPVVEWHPGAIRYLKEAGLSYAEFK